MTLHLQTTKSYPIFWIGQTSDIAKTSIPLVNDTSSPIEDRITNQFTNWSTVGFSNYLFNFVLIFKYERKTFNSFPNWASQELKSTFQIFLGWFEWSIWFLYFIRISLSTPKTYFFILVAGVGLLGSLILLIIICYIL